MTDAIRIANCSGFYGDRLSAAKEMVESQMHSFCFRKAGRYRPPLDSLIPIQPYGAPWGP